MTTATAAVESPVQSVAVVAASRSRRRLRIAFVVHDYNKIFGHSRYVAELVERFAAWHEVHVFANTFQDVPEGVVTHHVPAVRRGTLLTIFSFVIPASLMVGRRYDIVHSQGFSMIGADILTAHISNARWLEGRRLLAGPELSWRERLFGAVVIPPERWSMRRMRSTVIAVSGRLREDLHLLYGRAGETVVIPHGVDPRQFHPGLRRAYRQEVRRGIGVADDEVLFLSVGDFRKGFETAIRALASVPDVRLLGVSRTDPQPYRQCARDCGVDGRVIIQPGTSQIERCYAAADALVMPTPYDAFGMVITEALACGLPVITTPLAGAAELLEDGIHGLLIPSAADVDGLATAMTTMKRAEVRTRMSVAAADLMREHTWDRVADQTLDVYYAHLERHAAR